jgi:antitoxin component YwqK of YwqJK toxin-antitoxin module
VLGINNFKMKTTLFLLATILCGYFFSQERVKASECDNIQGIRVLKSTGKPFTGIVYQNYDSGELNYEKNHIEGKRIGWQKHYSKEGKILGEVNLINGNGILLVKHENGQPYIEANYQNGLVSGLYKRWHENGQLSEESNYQNGMLNGVYRSWDENGQLYEESNYTNDKYNGIYKWFENGILRENCIYQDGEKITCKNYNESGLLVTEDIYGLKKYHNDNGKLIKEFLVGVTKEYNEIGVVINEYPINSEYKTYNDQGILIKEERGDLVIEYNANGIKISEYSSIDGSAQTWYDSGQLKSSTDYDFVSQENEDIKTEKYYFENGKLKKEKKSKVFVSQEKEKEVEILYCKCYNEKGKEVKCEK